MMTGMLRGGEMGLLITEDMAELAPDEEELALNDMGEEGSVVGVVMKVPMLLALSISRISRVASIPDLTGS